MKKIITLAFSLILALSLTACGGNSNMDGGSNIGSDISEGMSDIGSAAESTVDDVKSGVQSATAKITEDEAKAAALKQAGVEEKDITGLDIDLETENGTLVYDIDFKSGDKEYSYDVDAQTGKIVERDTDRMD